METQKLEQEHLEKINEFREQYAEFNTKIGAVATDEYIVSEQLKEIKKTKDEFFEELKTIKQNEEEFIKEVYKKDFIDFTGIINVGSKKKISKHLFVKKFYKIFQIKNNKINQIRGPINFFKIRNEVLNLNTKKILKLGIKLPTIDQSIKLIKKHLNENKSL